LFLYIRRDSEERRESDNIFSPNVVGSVTLGLAHCQLTYSERNFRFANALDGSWLLVSGVLRDATEEPIDPKGLLEILRANQSSQMEIFTSLYGAFAMFFYDSVSECLSVIRDRLGYVPIYWKSLEGAICISDYPTSILEKSKSDVSYNKLIDYVVCRYDEVWGHTETFFKDIDQVKPGSILRINKGGEILSQVNYWSMAEQRPKVNNSLTMAQALKRLEEMLCSEFRRKVDSGIDPSRAVISLSGGLDSTALAVTAKLVGYGLPCMTACMTGVVSANDESQIAAESAKTLGLACESVKIDAESFLERWEAAYDVHPFPLPSSSYIGYEILAGFAKSLGYEHIGMGGSADDVFCGNHVHFLYNLADLLVESSPRFDRELSRWIELYNSSVYPKSAATFMEYAQTHVDLNRQGKINPKRRIIGGHFLRPNALSAIFSSSKPVEISAFDYLTALNVYGCYHSMRSPGLVAFSTIAARNEVRYFELFDSHSFFEFGITLLKELKIFEGKGKVLLRKFVKSNVVSYDDDSRPKVGFDVPWGAWLDKREFRLFVRKVFDSPASRDLNRFVNVDLLKSSTLETVGDPPDRMFLWQFLNASMWLQKKL